MSAVPVPRLEFQTMRMSDLAAVNAAEQRIYPFPWTHGNFVDSMNAGHRGWLCYDGGEMVGYAVVMEVIDEVHLLNISVLPERQRGGIGSAMLEFLLDDERGRGAKSMFLEVRPSNVSGLALYKRFGFETVGERRDYYPAQSGRENAIVMKKVI